ncbi:thiamine pyrophosphate-dependent dehydrogenase E1 component subunit alpha [Pararhodobacter sp. SW119]|uniref:thiamine pyrophosphate-dependent dehydrogenase E1 component subunit alpha n=1 Tax=Pararhodobacter sp. SW119 TaxID=2780075 RepID=UPI001ADF26C9|nr:thiamine pyrophosphate-dependent dehydrogenase E1 component subunit alpha [Pararhodobacter sp. SW119]
MTPEQLIHALEQMLLIRAHEEATAALQRDGRGPGTCTAVGQEAAAVGVVSALSAEDEILTNHRSIGHLLARGADPRRTMAEILGRQDGYCGGKSGSLHISARELGVVLTSTIVGGELALVTGVALARKMARRPGIVACFFGDGAACQGRFHESVNLAGVWDLPILYVCENNQWQAFVHRKETMRIDKIASRAAAYGIEGATVDGNDVAAVHAAAREARARIEATGAPFLLEVVTYRLRGHFEPDDQAYVDPAELDTWRRRDPIARLKDRLLAEGHLTAQSLTALEASVARSIAAAITFAEASPVPPLRELKTHVYA